VVLPARIKQISVNDSKFNVNLMARKQDLRSHKDWVTLSVEDSKWFYIDPADLENKKMIEEEKQRNAKYIPRRITHKRFRNMSLLRANEFLSGKDVGEFVFRPSSRGDDHLTLTIKFYKNVYTHADIVEENKTPGAIIGTKLWIGPEYYDTLDEIIARYVTPIVDYAKETAGHRKFFDAVSLKAVEDHILEEELKNSNIIAYCFSILPDFPQHIVLVYSPKKDKVVKEYIKVRVLRYHN
jgi:transcription elongation factor SPT6